MLQTPSDHSAATTDLKAAFSHKLWWGKPVAHTIYEQIQHVATQSATRVPHLAIIVSSASPNDHHVSVADDTAAYVRQKLQKLRELGWQHTLRLVTSDWECHQVIHAFNADRGIHGIVLQYPTPFASAGTLIDARKDVDGLNWSCPASASACRPCTAEAVVAILRHHPHLLQHRKEAVVIGRSKLVGQPIAELLARELHFNVTTVHRQTTDMDALVSQADLVVSCAGSHGVVHAGNVKPGAVVIDVGITTGPGGKLRGDVAWSSALLKNVDAITPVPGGVGPVTVAMLMRNLWRCFARQCT